MHSRNSMSRVDKRCIVRDQDDRFSKLGVQPLEQTDQRLPRYGIESARWFVTQQKGRIRGEGARRGNALLLSAAELSGKVNPSTSTQRSANMS